VPGASILGDPTPPSTVPGASIVTSPPATPGASIISSRPATPGASIISSTPAAGSIGGAPTAAAAPPSQPMSPGGSPLPVRGLATTPAAGQSALLQLLAASAAARRQLDAQVADAEATLAQRQTELAAAQAALQAAEQQNDELRTAVDDSAARLVRAEGTVSVLTQVQTAAAAAAARRTTPMGYPLPSGHSARQDADRARQALADAERQRDAAAAALHGAEQAWDAAGPMVDDARRKAADLAEEVGQRANALAGLRQQLAAAVAAGMAASASVVHALTTEGAQAPTPSALAVSDIPADYLDLYRRKAESCPGLSWTVLAAIGSIETSHGRSNAPGVHAGANPAGAMGPMQFLGPTWDAYGVDGNGDGIRDVYNPADAVAGAASYLCASGGGHLASLASAVWNYNHADWYVASVLELAGAYGGGGLEAPAAPVTAARLVANPNVTLSAAARGDILGGVADPRVVQLLAAAATHHRISVSVVKTGHDQFVHGTNRVSNHFGGRAVDITDVDGAPVTPSNSAALELALSILTTEAPLRPDEFGSPWAELSRFPGGFSDDDHQDHLHVGWGA
jgi:hypothetical protein